MRTLRLPGGGGALLKEQLVVCRVMSTHDSSTFLDEFVDTRHTTISRSPRTHRWVPSHSPTVSCAYRAAGWRQSLPTCSPSIPSSARAAAPACRRAEALEVRYPAAVGVGEEAHSRQQHWCPWSKPVNVETWGHVPGPVVMAHALAELRYGIVARQHENGFKCGHNFAQTL